MKILYEDKYLIICIKEAGVLSQHSQTDRNNMVTIISEYINCSEDKIIPVHRLDRNVSGVMVYSKDKKTAGKLSEAIQKNNFIKEYLAVVKGIPENNEGILKDLLFKDSSKNKTFVVKRMRRGVKEASLEYSKIDETKILNNDMSLLKIRLHTGRTHQIRVQFASRKHPLLGDGKYGSKDNKCDAALFSFRLSFTHPITGESMNFKAFPENIYPWNYFESSIKKLSDDSVS